MATNRADRRRARADRAAVFGEPAEAALTVLELLEYAWHDCYEEVTPPDPVLEDVWLVADGDLAALVGAAHLALIDVPDLRVSADARRAGLIVRRVRRRADPRVRRWRGRRRGR